MPGAYSFLTKITDPAIRSAFKVLMDRVNTLEQSATADLGAVRKPLDAALDGGDNQLKAIADPTHDQDAVTLGYLKQYVDDRLMSAGLIDETGQAVTPTDSDNGQTQAGVTAAGADGHASGSDLTAYRAGLIIGGTAHEYPALIAATPDQATRDVNQAELLSRIIWHLQQGGFTAGKQRNPSGAISGDKIALIEDGSLRAFDIFTGVYSSPMTVQAFQVEPPDLVSDAGTPD